MVRYYAIATVIVLALLAAGFHSYQIRIAMDMAHVDATGTPTAGRRSHADRNVRPFIGDAPWALSALPDCYRMCSVVRGSAKSVRSVLPLRAQRIAAGATQDSGTCRLTVTANAILIRRGEDRLRIPPPAELASLDGGYALFEIVRGRAILRTYRRRLRSGAFSHCHRLQLLAQRSPAAGTRKPR